MFNPLNKAFKRLFALGSLTCRSMPEPEKDDDAAFCKTWRHRAVFEVVLVVIQNYQDRKWSLQKENAILKGFRDNSYPYLSRCMPLRGPLQEDRNTRIGLKPYKTTLETALPWELLWRNDCSGESPNVWAVVLQNKASEGIPKQAPHGHMAV